MIPAVGTDAAPKFNRTSAHLFEQLTIERYTNFPRFRKSPEWSVSYFARDSRRGAYGAIGVHRRYRPRPPAPSQVRPDTDNDR
jgi:hypothetical protein